MRLMSPKGFGWKLREIFLKVLVAGDDAGRLTAEGAKLLDVSGASGRPGFPRRKVMKIPEWAATNSVAASGPVTYPPVQSVFCMIVLEKDLSQYEAIDIVTTPAGHPGRNGTL